MLQQFTTTLERQTAGRGLLELTADVSGWFAGSGCREGLLTLFVRHTSDQGRQCALRGRGRRAASRRPACRC